MDANPAGAAHHPQGLLPWADRLAVAVAVLGLLTLAWQSAERNSQQALQLAALSLAGPAAHVTLPAVQVVGRRDSLGAGAAATAPLA